MILQPILIRSIESVTNFVTYQKVIDDITSSFPHRQGEHTGMNIKAGSLYFLVLNYKVFGRKQSGKVGLDFVVDGHRFDFL
jgi:hypothetical protein